MKAIKFEDVNVEFAKDQEEYTSLPALRIGDDHDTIVTCWKLTLWERIKLLFQGHFWMSEMNFNRALTPRYFSVNRKDVYTKPSDKD
ncbi:hypothetical protein [Flagellimonas nanhaiensis]|uniref:Uncharacterized protein n=1 Tax=Flagellimonas nanhaiensis TaxID=2292706 RepID=A0A371JL58_9FLAO|nr:hypothetical protein [Allomuricauda nanhaiensis]RDY57695.1 hypothetical protein DX873_17495 [Allomuricauda nanhaiensis]